MSTLSFLKKHFKKMLNEDFLSLDKKNKFELINEGLGLNIFLEDPDWEVRLEVARKGKYLEILKDDLDCAVSFEATYQLSKFYE